MKEKLAAALNDLRWIAGLTLIAVLGLAVCGKFWFDAREETRAVERGTAALEQRVRSLEDRVIEEREHRDRMIRIDRGRGPGGIRSPWEEFLFHGPTAARSALELVLAAESAGFDRLRYAAEDVRIVGTFPPDAQTDGMESTTESAGPIRDRIDFVEWPIALAVETDWDSVVDLLGRIAEARPAFAVRSIEVEVLRDGRGEPIDGLSLDGRLSTHWVAPQGDGS